MRDESGDLRLHLLAAMAEALPHPARGDPLDAILADHYRIRAMLALLQDLARGRATPRVREILGRALLSFLRLDLPRHLAIEEAHVFPLLEQRLRPSDLLDPSLRRLAEQHRAAEAAMALLIEEIERLLRDPAAQPAPRLRRCAALFAQEEQRHLAVENAVVLPLARARLTRRDLAGLAREIGALPTVQGPAARAAAPKSASAWSAMPR
jgi:hemerythrin-like domain-containing protein